MKLLRVERDAENPFAGILPYEILIIIRRYKIEMEMRAWTQAIERLNRLISHYHHRSTNRLLPRYKRSRALRKKKAYQEELKALVSEEIVGKQE